MEGRDPILKTIACLALLIGAAGCGSDPQGPGAWSPEEPDDPVPAGDRLWGIAVTESSDGFLPSFDVAQQSGIQVIELNIPWDSLETGQGVYRDPYGGALAATAFFAMNDVEVSLSIAVVNTVCRCTPGYLDSLPLSSPEVVSAFEGVLDYVMSQVPGDVSVPGISIGNEIDLVLDGYDDWVDYIAFLAAAADYVHSTWPGVVVGGKCTVMNGVLGPDLEYVQALNQCTDVVMLTYYPQDGSFAVLEPSSVHTHLDQIVAAFPGRDVWLCEVGYQSGSEYCGSSEEQQASFYHEFFAAWDEHADEIGLAIVDWLHDVSPETLEDLLVYYGLSDPGFVEYLATLGLRNHDGTDKYAWLQVLGETSARGWQR